MDWQQLKDYFDQAYDFFDRINIVKYSGYQSTKVHPLIKVSTELILKAISSENHNRLVILVPSNLHCAQWIAALSTFDIMKKDYESRPGTVQFPKGQRLMVKGGTARGCIVEYMGEEYSPYMNHRLMKVGCGNGAIYWMQLNRKLAFQPISTTRPLSSLEQVSNAVKSAQKLNNPIDDILQTRTMGNKGLFKANLILVSRIGETEQFIKQYYINQTSIADLFLWGKLNTKGTTTIVGSQQIQANPCCLVSSDLANALNYISNNPDRNKGVIIEGCYHYFNNIQVLDEMLDNNIPIAVVCDLMETEKLWLLTERDFRIWQWNKSNITQSGSIVQTPKHSPFFFLNNSIHNYCNQTTDILLCEYPELNNVAEESFKLGRMIPSEQLQINHAYAKLIRQINDISRLIRIPKKDWAEALLQDLQLLQHQWESQQLWLPDEAVQCTQRIFEALPGIMEDLVAGKNPKVDKLYDFMSEDSDSSMLGIIIAKPDEIEESITCWSDLLPEGKISNIHFTTISEMLEPTKPWSPDHIVVCGWLRSDRIYNLLHSYITSKITILAYPFEQKWFKQAQLKWTKQNNFNIRTKDFSGMLGLAEEELKSIEYEAEEPAEPLEKGESDIFEFELKLRTHQYNTYKSSLGTAEDLCRARLVIFSQNNFAFLTESHRLPVVTDIVMGNDIELEIPRKTVDELRIGDYILFHESSKDIIREIADKGLDKAGQSRLREIAGLWKEALYEAHSKMPGGLHSIVEMLQKVGCRRNQDTIKKWLTDEEQIGPKFSTDLQLIAKATGNKTLIENLPQVQEAISAIRGAHIQASRYVRSKLLSTLPEIVEGKERAFGYGRESIQLNLDEFGQVTIIRIEDIADDWEDIAINSVNYMMSVED
jgi:hypothetical protein